MNRTVFLGVDLGQSAVRCYHAPLHHLKTVPSVQIVRRKFQCLSSQSRRFVTQQIWLHQVRIRRKHETSAVKTQYGLHIAFSRNRRVAVACASERKATIVNLKATSCASSGSYCIRYIGKLCFSRDLDGQSSILRPLEYSRQFRIFSGKFMQQSCKTMI